MAAIVMPSAAEKLRAAARAPFAMFEDPTARARMWSCPCEHVPIASNAHGYGALRWACRRMDSSDASFTAASLRALAA